MSLTGNNILGGASGQTTGYDIEQSVRFNSPDSARLTRTAGTATSNDIGTFSFWIKRGLVSGGRGFFSNHSDASNRTQITFDADKIMMYGVIGGSGSSPELVTTQVFRDPAAWYHIVIAVDVTQSTASNRVKIYVNGSQVTDFSTGTYPPQDTDLPLFSKTNMQVGAVYDGSVGGYYDGYFAEYYYIDGQALAPSSFGETNEDTNQWQAIEYDGSYGDNGFYLKFQDSSALGDDSSGNTNDFTVTNLVATDQVLDSPTNNFCTMNPLDKASDSYNTLKEGNLHLEATGQGSALSTFAMSSGKWYWECLVTIEPTWWPVVGFCKTTANVGVGNQNYTGEQTGSWGYLTETGAWYVDGSTSSTYTAVSAGNIMQFAIDMDAGKAWVGINNTWVNSGNPATGANAIVTSGLTGDITPAFSDSDAAGHDLVANFGQDSSFAGAKTAQGNGGDGEDFYYTPPTGFKALNTDNLSDPSIADPTAHFNTVLYTGNSGSNQSVTGVNFSPDFLWIKPRDYVDNHGLIDSVRGGNYNLWSNSTSAEQDNTGGNDAVTLDSDGFTVNQFSNSWNRNGYLFVSWNWKAGGTASTNENGTIDSSVSANTTAGFSIVNWNGTEASATIGHGLSQAPELIIVKDVDSARSWPVNIENITGTANQYLLLDTTAAQATSTAYWGGTPGASVFTVGDSANTNDDASMIAYCFHSVEGYSKIGKYTGNGSTDGTFVYTGFRPAFVMIKRYDSSSGANWILLDSKRDTFNAVEDSIYANLSNAEDATDRLDFVSNGFKLRQNGTTVNTSSGTYIYLAIAESPFKTSNAR